MDMSQVEFNQKIGVVIPSTKTVRDGLAQAVQEAMPNTPNGDPVNVDSTAPMGQIIDLATAEVEAKNAEIAFLANMSNIKTSRGIFLDALGSLYGIDRKVSEPTVVTCVCTGLKGTVIPYGAIVQDTQGNQFRHSVVSGVSIGEEGVISTTFSAVEHGAIEVSPKTVNKIITVIAGWDTVTNPDSGILGRDLEPDGEYMNRIKSSYAKNALGSLENIQANLSNLDGVLDCVVLENYTKEYQTKYGIRLDPHSIAVCIVGGEDEAIAEQIYRSKDLGCGTTGNYEVNYIAVDHFNASYTYKIIRPSSEDFKIKLELFDSTINEEDKKAIIKALIADFVGEGVNQRVKLATTVYASRFYAAVIGATETPVKAIEIALGEGDFADSIEIPANVEPAISEENIQFVFLGR